jgi:predicted secreted Zn-dependent protease
MLRLDPVNVRRGSSSFDGMVLDPARALCAVALFAAASCQAPAPGHRAGATSAAAHAPKAAPSAAEAPSPPGGAPAVALRAGITEADERVDYEVVGSTGAEVRADIDAKAPRRDGRWFAAFTEWHVDWRFDFSSAANRCALVSPRVTLRVKYTYPRWQAPAGAPAALTGKWASYHAALELHEAGHRDLGAAAANEIAELLARPQSSATCPAIESSANEEAEAVLAKYRRREIEYDGTTRHGVTQGATFP